MHVPLRTRETAYAVAYARSSRAFALQTRLGVRAPADTVTSPTTRECLPEIVTLSDVDDRSE